MRLLSTPQTTSAGRFMQSRRRHSPRSQPEPFCRGELTMAYRKSEGTKAVWPPPIYVATLASGRMVRMPFYSRQGRPLDFATGRRGCAGVLSDLPRFEDFVHLKPE